MDHHRTGAHFGIVPNPDVAQYLRSGTDHHAVPNGRMALAPFLAGSTQRHALIHQNVLADFRCFTDHHPCTVINEAAPPDLRARMNLDPSAGPDELRSDTRRN